MNKTFQKTTFPLHGNKYEKLYIIYKDYFEHQGIIMNNEIHN